ncbi:MAG: site-specific DNA-methyltransferase, partial [Candidatus Magasanikbacteria bacterium CG10_big_fil_rev_8_21_14_0_10_38_6]
MKNYKEMTHEELLGYVEELQNRKKYGLVWEDKPEDVVEQCKEMLPVLEEVSDRAIEKDDNGVTNLLIEGDNYHALSVLNYTHAGKIDVIYIDPPYNTGNKDFVYNDQYVDKEDSYRHSKWISFIEKRLSSIKHLLKQDGVFFVSIDDNEQASLKLLCDEIFGEENFITQFIWRRSGTGGLRGIFPVTTHEYILVYAKNKLSITNKWFAPYSENSRNAFKSSDEKGEYKTQALYLTSLKYVDSQAYFIDLPDGTRAKPPLGRGSWRYVESTYRDELEKGNILFKKVKTSPLLLANGERASYNIYTKQYISDEGTNPPSILPDDIVGQTRSAKSELKKMFGSDVFDYAKPSTLIKYIIQLVNKSEGITILDFFAGTGTTGHAVLELNKEDGGSRQFILCTNNENGIAEEVTYPRVKNVIDGYADVEGIPANLRYFKTAFVKQTSVSDDTRRELVKKSTEMICVKESTYKKVYDNKKYKVYKNNEYITGILFDLDSIKEFKEKIDGAGMPAHLYIFSLSNDTFSDDFSSLEVEHTLCPIPESVLEV